MEVREQGRKKKSQRTFGPPSRAELEPRKQGKRAFFSALFSIEV